jgi:hypothetical protein
MFTLVYNGLNPTCTHSASRFHKANEGGSYLDHFFYKKLIFSEKFSEKDESEKFRLPPFPIKTEMLQCTTVSNLNVALKLLSWS